MNTIKLISSAVFLTGLLLLGCNRKKNEVIIIAKSTEVKGDLSSYFEVIDKDYALTTDEGAPGQDAVLTIELYRTSKNFDFPIENAIPIGTNNTRNYAIGFGIELNTISKMVWQKNATEKNASASYTFTDIKNLLKLKKGEYGTLRLHVKKRDKLKSFQLTSVIQKPL